MSMRDILDEARANFVNSDDSPTRAIIYTRSSDDTQIPLEVYVGGGSFSKEEKERIEDFEVFRTLSLDVQPETGVTGDTIFYDSVVFRVRRVVKAGPFWTVVGEIARNKGRR